MKTNLYLLFYNTEKLSQVKRLKTPDTRVKLQHRVKFIDSLLSYWDPGAQGSQVETLKAEQPGVVLLKITGVGVRLVASSMRVLFITAGVSVVWLITMPGGERISVISVQTNKGRNIQM